MIMTRSLNAKETAGIEIFNRLADGSEGGTLDTLGCALPDHGYYVGGAVETLVLADANTTGALFRLVDFASDAPTRFIGYWVDSETGLTHVDAVDWFADESTAAKLGRERREIAVWDIARERELRLTYVDGE